MTYIHRNTPLNFEIYSYSANYYLYSESHVNWSTRFRVRTPLIQVYTYVFDTPCEPWSLNETYTIINCYPKHSATETTDHFSTPKANLNKNEISITPTNHPIFEKLSNIIFFKNATRRSLFSGETKYVAEVLKRRVLPRTKRVERKRNESSWSEANVIVSRP